MAEQRRKCAWTFSWAFGLGPRSLQLQNENMHLLSAIFRQSQHPQWSWIAGFRCCSLHNIIVICCWNKNQQGLCCQKDLWPPTPLWDTWKWGRTMFITKVSASHWKLFKFPYNTLYWPLPDSISRGHLWQRTCKPWTCSTVLSAGWRRAERNPVREEEWGRYKACSQSGETLPASYTGVDQAWILKACPNRP